jgi:two-component system sensor histidine kinase HydH
VPLDVNEVVRSTVQVISSDPTQACEFDVLLASSLPPVRGDAEQLRQVLLNLIKNAAQAMDGGGVLTLRTRLLPEESASGGPDQVEIAVSDTGRGLSEEERRGIFVPFFTTKPKGTGLGLAISQRIVQEMAGRLEVFSQLGQGSTFALRLPALSVTECRPADGTEVRADVAINGTS